MRSIFAALALVAACTMPGLAAAAQLDLPPRKQWNANSGYCGETSLISAGLHFGQYCSQFTARQLASPRVKQSDPASQLLVGVNDAKAAKAMKLEAKTFSYTWQMSPWSFLAWIKDHLAQGHPTIIGVFNNVTRLGEEAPGDDEYDHIVPVLGIDSKTPTSKAGKNVSRDDVIRFSDNGLYTPEDRPVYFFGIPLADFLQNRRSANAPNAPVYSLKDKPANYGVAVTGVADPEGVTVPVRLTASRNDEPELADGSNAPPKAAPLRLTATVAIPDQSVAYKLYRYDSFEKVPVRAFNAAADKAVQSWDIPAHSGRTFAVTHDTDTGATVAFRAVPVSAP